MSRTMDTINEPHLKDIHGRAWEIDFNAIYNKYPASSFIFGWVLEVPWAHHLWKYHTIVLTHLRKDKALPEPIIQVKGATHELLVCAVDPDWEFNLQCLPRTLRPLNFIAQFTAPDDRAALVRVQASVHEVLRGELNPDSDGIREWALRYGRGMLKG